MVGLLLGSAGASGGEKERISGTGRGVVVRVVRGCDGYCDGYCYGYCDGYCEGCDDFRAMKGCEGCESYEGL